MKPIYQYASILCLLILMPGCGQYLEENPDNRVDLNTPEKAAQLLTNAYPATAYTFTEWMSDNVVYTTGTTKQPEHDQAYRWEDMIGDNQDTPTSYWGYAYEAIAHANEVLAVIDDLPGERDFRKSVEAEALLTRAYAHFMLVNLFAKHFDPATANDDPGIPYVMEPETVFIKQYERLSVEEVYERIEEDLLEGLEDIDDGRYSNSGKYHFTRNAALAFASRFYLFKGDYNNCIRYSSQMLGIDPGIYVKDIYDLFEETVTLDEFIKEFTSPTDPSNLLLIRNVTNFPVSVGYWPDINLINSLFYQNPWGAEDVRRSDDYPIYLRGSGVTLNKYEFLFERSSLTSNVGLYYTIMVAFRGEEVLLNRAEGYAMTGNIDLAMADIRVFVGKRYDDAPTPTIQMLRSYYENAGDDQEALMQYIVEERRKEFIHEGLRWFDIKRFDIPVTHNLEDGSLIELGVQDNRKVLQLPQSAIDVGGLESNPR